MGRKSNARSQGLLLLCLLGILGGVGAWNYQRNVALENAEVRPYRTLSDADLAGLLEAAEGEAAAATRRYEQLRDAAAPSAKPASSGRWSGFERAQQRGRAVRQLGHEAAEHEAMVAELREEQSRRAGEGDAMQRLLRRVFGTGSQR